MQFPDQTVAVTLVGGMLVGPALDLSIYKT